MKAEAAKPVKGMTMRQKRVAGMIGRGGQKHKAAEPVKGKTKKAAEPVKGRWVYMKGTCRRKSICLS